VYKHYKNDVNNRREVKNSFSNFCFIFVINFWYKKNYIKYKKLFIKLLLVYLIKLKINLIKIKENFFNIFF
jgi:hypothetical protein